MDKKSQQNVRPAIAETNRISLDRRLLVSLSYLNLLFLIPLAVLGKERFSSFHIKQGFTLFLIEIVGTTIITLLDVVTFGVLAKIITPFFWLLIVFLTCWGIVSVLRSRRDKIFLLSSLVEWFEL